MKTQFTDYNSAFYFILFVFVLSILTSRWLLQENGPWDFYVFIFMAIPINLILLLILILMRKSNRE